MKSDIQFANEKLMGSFQKLSDGNYEERQLKKFIERAFRDITENAFCVVQIPKRIIPEIYIKLYNVKNLWKYNLPNAWRLIYSLEKGRINIISIILEWLDHKEYERRFKY